MKLDLDEHLPYRIAVVSNLLALNRDAVIRAQTDLGLRELRVLINIGSYGPLKATEVARQSRIDSFTISRAVSTLAKEKLISLVPDPADRRSPYIELTGKGETLYNNIAESMTSRAEEIEQDLSAEERQLLIRLMKRVEDRAEEVLAGHAIDALQREGKIPADQRELIRWFKKRN